MIINKNQDEKLKLLAGSSDDFIRTVLTDQKACNMMTSFYTAAISDVYVSNFISKIFFIVGNGQIVLESCSFFLHIIAESIFDSKRIVFIFKQYTSNIGLRQICL